MSSINKNIARRYLYIYKLSQAPIGSRSFEASRPPCFLNTRIKPESYMASDDSSHRCLPAGLEEGFLPVLAPEFQSLSSVA
ncbi:unnamed protein product [Diplocarpon coronariae]